jgi:hypothetical protein
MASNPPKDPTRGPERLGERSDEPTHDEGRRALLKHGLVAVPLIATLAARPAQASGRGMGSLGAYDYHGDRDHDDDPWDDDDRWDRERDHDDRWGGGGWRRRRG